MQPSEVTLDSSPSSDSPTPELFDFDVEHDRVRAVFRLRGELDLYPLPRLQESFEEAVDQGVREAVFDFGDVTFLGSTGMNFLVVADRKLNELGGSCKVERIPPVIYRLLEIAGLHQVLDLEHSERQDPDERHPV